MTKSDTNVRMAHAIRFLSADAVQKANSGHPGLPMGAADIATVLFTRFMKFDPKNPNWPIFIGKQRCSNDSSLKQNGRAH